MQNFIQNILNVLKTNGFPQKRVSLPTEKMYEAADNKGMSFNLVIQELKEKHNIEAQVGSEKIIFSQTQASKTGQEDMMKQAQEMMSKMSPEELKRLQDMFMNMSDEEKAEIMKKGKDMGFI